MIKVHQHALINQNCDQIMCSCDQLRKLVAQVWPVGRMSLEPWYIYISGLTDLSWSVIHTDQAPRFSTHVILGFISKCNHNRVKVYHLFLFTQANFKQFQGEKAKGNSICYSCAILCAQPHICEACARRERHVSDGARTPNWILWTDTYT